ncbi:MAG: DinB family protein [Opitutales bacterium]
MIEKVFIRSWFALSNRNAGIQRILKMREAYESLINGIDPLYVTQPATVPAMPGVDPDMRHWSILQILEHNVIVNRSIGLTVDTLARGKDTSELDQFDPKHDVMPSQSPDPHSLQSHTESINTYLRTLEKLPKLRNTQTYNHPVFGPFDAHKWHQMFGFHLILHYRQARVALKTIS